MKNSSNINMEDVFDHLAKIKKVEPNINLYSHTMDRLQHQNVVPLFWVRAVACILIVLMSTEFYLVSNMANTNHQEASIVISNTNNILYHE